MFSIADNYFSERKHKIQVDIGIDRNGCMYQGQVYVHIDILSLLSFAEKRNTGSENRKYTISS